MEHLPHVLAAAAIWFLGTGLVLRVVRARRARHRFALVAGAGVATVALVAVVWSVGETSVATSYAGFAGAVAIWGWLELAFLTGAVTGPSRLPCPPTARSLVRFRLATATLIHHELSLAAALAILAGLCLGQPNPVAALTFALLFTMRLSTKLNLFAGVANPSTELLPPQLAHLASYFRRRPFGVRMALSLAAAAALAAWLGARALETQGGEAVGFTLMFALAALGVVEHAILALPVRDAALWGWALPRTATPRTLTLSPTTATSLQTAARP